MFATDRGPNGLPDVPRGRELRRDCAQGEPPRAEFTGDADGLGLVRAGEEGAPIVREALPERHGPWHALAPGGSLSQGQPGHVRKPTRIMRRDDGDLGMPLVNSDQAEKSAPQGLLLFAEEPAHQPGLLLAPRHSFEPPDDVPDEAYRLPEGRLTKTMTDPGIWPGACALTTEPSP